MRIVWMALLGLLLLAPGVAQKKSPPSVGMKLVKLDKTTTSNPNESLYEFSLELTNTGTELVRFNNNEVLLVDNQDKYHRVVRLRNRQVMILKPGESVVADRMFYQLPNEVKPKRAVLRVGNKILGETGL